MRSPAFAVLVLLLSTTLNAQTVSTVAGSPAGVAGLRDGRADEAQFNRPTWLDVEPGSGAIYVIDRANHRLRKIANGDVTTRNVTSPWWANPVLPVTFDFGGPYGGGIAVEPRSAGCGGASYAQGMFISSSAKHQIAFIVDTGSFLTFADRDDSSWLLGAGIPGALDLDQLRSQFNNPGDVALSWNYGGNGGTYRTDALYIADTGNHTIRRIRYRLSFEACPQPYFIGTLAGIAGSPGATDGSVMTAQFNAPRGVAAAPDGSVYVADTGNHTIRRIAVDGTVTTVAGQAGVPGNNDGLATEAHLTNPSGIDINELGEVFIADTGNFVVRKLTIDGRLITIAGTPGVAGYADGPARTARFSGPIGLRLWGNALYIADTANNAIRKLDFDAAEPKRRAAHH
jgi:DNA-binding beta-propeller fold protein YncE